LFEEPGRALRRIVRKRVRKRTDKKPGTSPGSLIHIGRERTEPVRIRLIRYDDDYLEDVYVDRIDDVFPLRERPAVNWIDIDGIHDVPVIERIGQLFQLHPLLLEDILTSDQRPKTDEYDDCLFIVLRMLSLDDDFKITSEQMSFVLGRNYVLSFQELPGDIFDPIRERIQAARGRIRRGGADYLTYALIDSIVDHYFLVLEGMGERLATLEDEAVDDATTQTLEHIHGVKRQLIFLRRSIWPLRDVVSLLTREDSDLISEQTRIYLRDVYDHTVQVIDIVESYRDITSSLMDVHLSITSNRLNEVMKVLTMIATIFIPLTFIVGVYGMNFDYMPELHVQWAYPVIWGIMIAVSAGLLLYFKRKGWM